MRSDEDDHERRSKILWISLFIFPYHIQPLTHIDRCKKVIVYYRVLKLQIRSVCWLRKRFDVTFYQSGFRTGFRPYWENRVHWKCFLVQTGSFLTSSLSAVSPPPCTDITNFASSSSFFNHLLLFLQSFIESFKSLSFPLKRFSGVQLNLIWSINSFAF